MIMKKRGFKIICSQGLFTKLYFRTYIFKTRGLLILCRISDQENDWQQFNFIHSVVSSMDPNFKT